MAAGTGRGWLGRMAWIRHFWGPILALAGLAYITFRYFPLTK